MELSPRTYGDSFADVYDEWYGSPPPDGCIDTLRALASDAPGPLLELGAGTGRLALPLVERDVDVMALDASAPMLDQLLHKQHARSRRAFVVLGDMRELPLRDACCGLVLCATNNLFGLGDREGQAHCLVEAARVLTDGGLLVVETVVPAPPPARKEQHLEPGRALDPGRVVLTATERDPGSEVVRGAHVELTSTGPRLRPWRLALADPEELDRMVVAHGFVRRDRWGDWRGSPFDPDVHTAAVSVYGRETPR